MKPLRTVSAGLRTYCVAKNSSILGTTASLLIGIGIGVGLGMLLAPASGEETRSNIADKVQDFGGKVRDRFPAARGQSHGNIRGLIFYKPRGYHRALWLEPCTVVPRILTSFAWALACVSTEISTALPILRPSSLEGRSTFGTPPSF